jgi:hypothetical protein
MNAASIAAGEQIVVGAGLRLSRQLDGTGDQLMRPRRPQILWNPGAIAAIGDRQ